MPGETVLRVLSRRYRGRRLSVSIFLLHWICGNGCAHGDTAITVHHGLVQRVAPCLLHLQPLMQSGAKGSCELEKDKSEVRGTKLGVMSATVRQGTHGQTDTPGSSAERSDEPDG